MSGACRFQVLPLLPDPSEGLTTRTFDANHIMMLLRIFDEGNLFMWDAHLFMSHVLKTQQHTVNT